ncbi:MAG: rhodanese-like domain-containing protein [Oscillospiraceae bacterium]|nr:rhodanese-like domain-containing protein [Oscillospiraceae bacterium]
MKHCNIIKIITICLAAAFLFVGCNFSLKEEGFMNISQETAKEIMDTKECIILDVRTPEEFAEGHIPGAILIPDYEIAEKAPNILTDQDALILVYCRSGRRSKNAANQLVDMGYTNIKEFGGIIDWPYETTKE